MYSEYGSVQQSLADEITISNMLKVLTTPQLCMNFSPEEQREVIEAVKKHIVVNANRVNETLKCDYHR